MRMEEGKSVPSTFGEYLKFVEDIRPHSGATAILEWKMKRSKATAQTEVTIPHDRILEYLGRGLVVSYEEMMERMEAERKKLDDTMEVVSHLIGHLSGESEDSMRLRKVAESKGWNPSHTIDCLRMVQDERASQSLKVSAEDEDKNETKDWARLIKERLGRYLELTDETDRGVELTRIAAHAVAAMESLVRRSAKE